MIIKDIGHRREAVTAINVFDKANGIRTSQAAKYEKPMWYYVLACLSGYDGSKLTISNIIKKLAKHNIIVTNQQVRNAIHVMQNKHESIQPERRNCGINCFGAVTKLGDIKFSISNVGVGYGIPTRHYYLGCDGSTVNSVRREYDIALNP